MSGLWVLSPGPLSLLQDGGRHGWRHLGVPAGGPLDRHAAAWANRLLGNAVEAPLIEIALGGVELEARVDTWLALTGAEADVELDGAPLPAWSRFAVRRGQHLRIGFACSGQRLYLATAGGFHAVPVLGSVATQVREGLGGLDGAGSALKSGDLLRCSPASLHGRRSVPWRFRPDYRLPPRLRVIFGGDAEAFGAAQREALLQHSWQLSPQSDRMGARLLGEPIVAPRRQWSLGVMPGCVQVPPDGQPIILQADCQTMGGYPILGWLYPRDLWRLAQCPANQPVQFSAGSVAEAQAELRQFRSFFAG